MTGQHVCPSGGSARRSRAETVTFDFNNIICSPAVTHHLPISFADLDTLARCSTDFSMVYGGSASFVQHVLNGALDFLATEHGKKDVEERAARIMGRNDFGIHPKQACLANSLVNLKERLGAHFIEVQFDEAVKAGVLEKHTQAMLVCERLGGRRALLRELLESLVPQVVAQNEHMSKIAAQVFSCFRRM